MSTHAAPYVPATDVFRDLDTWAPITFPKHRTEAQSAPTPVSARSHVSAMEAPSFPMDAERAKWERYEH